MSEQKKPKPLHPERSKEAFDRLLEDARRDDRILAFWLDGSRGKGMVTDLSDYDCTMIVQDADCAALKDAYAALDDPGIDLRIYAMDEFEVHSAWGSESAWNRYIYAHLQPLVDKTGKIAELFKEKSRIPEQEVGAFVKNALGHYLNQVYRSMKNGRDGNMLGARLDAAESILPLLDALFAIHGHRVRPYSKYLAWELDHYPLEGIPWSASDFIKKIYGLLDAADLSAQQEILISVEPLFRAEGYGEEFDAWGDVLHWMKSFKRSP